MVWIRGLEVWLLIIIVESVHGTLRQLFLAPVIGDAEARRVAVFTGSALIFLVTWLTIRWIAMRNRSDLLKLGAIWVVLTAAFEFALGRALGFSLERILQDTMASSCLPSTESMMNPMFIYLSMERLLR